MLKAKDLSCFKTLEMLYLSFLKKFLYQKANDDLNNQASSDQIKKISVFCVMGVNILGSVVTHIFFYFFFWKSIFFYAF